MSKEGKTEGLTPLEKSIARGIIVHLLVTVRAMREASPNDPVLIAVEKHYLHAARHSLYSMLKDLPETEEEMAPGVPLHTFLALLTPEEEGEQA